ncbi:PilN domain-containing protein [Legionella oakridgensis]|uniref:PilN domain-containing protein n=1 Tax=Legionella oakridgensis TaxID=29423 RepID=UPI0003DE0470|nr:PilN domain-containing protein [Legionella oakridgensis]ETO93579.1 Tfp pilus assembly protein PilN [Legionella oakridgensis RV-2-2007]
MTEINLLPWRELKREREKKQFTTYLFFGLGSAVVVVFLINMYAKQLIENQSSRNQQLQNEITTLEKQIKEIEEIKNVRQALIARMVIIQNLQATRSLTVRLFDELVKIMPDGVFLTSVERQGDKIILLGYAESNSNISQLMRQIEHNKWIKEPDLTEIKKTKESSSGVENEFKLSFILSPKFDGPKL